ncbi:N-acetylmuramoyl-L-alanine amidase [Geodermatophilus sp. SYSU D00814]
MRRLVVGLLAFLGLTALVLVLPVSAAPGPEAEPVATSTAEVPMGSVAEPAPQAEVQAGTSDPVTGVPATAPALTVSRVGTEPFSLVGVTWRLDPAVTDTVVQVRVQDAEGAWGAWTEVTVEDAEQNRGTATGDEVRGGTAPLWTGPSTAVEAELVTRSGAQPTDVRLELVDPGTSPADGALQGADLGDTAHAATAMPPVFSRAQWGADESIMGWTPQYAPAVKAATLHHTDTSNGYAADDVPGIIRSIYAYHAQSRGWGDIGYNVLVDRFGRLWEGRAGGLSRPVVAAHAGGFNSGTLGVSMIGNHAATAPTQAELESLAAMIAWKFSLHGVDPRGTTVLTSGGGGTAKYAAGVKVTLPTVFGHRDVGNTTCPGDAGYARLGTLRDLVAARLTTSLSPIATRYAADAGLRASLGDPVGAEQSAGGVSWQVYERGRVYDSAAGGVRVVRGAILDTYLAWGGPAALGAPLTDDTPTAEGRGWYVDVQGGSIVWSAGTGAQVVRGDILREYQRVGGSAGLLGFPTTSDARTPDGRGYVVHFEGGDVHWSPATGARTVAGQILETWLATGGTSGPLGFPTSSDAPTPDGRGYVVRFQGGDVWWSGATGPQVVAGDILAEYRRTGGSAGPLGFPTTSDARTPDGRGYVVHFQGGDVWWSPATGARTVAGQILETWLAVGGTSGPLGFPTSSDARTTDGRGYTVSFQGGAVWWSGATGAHVVAGDILAEYRRAGGSGGPLGFPTTSDARTPDGRGYVVHFQGGDVWWSPATGAHTVAGEILTRWLGTGATSGPLGFPTTSDARTTDGRGYVVLFQGGGVWWSPATGAQAVAGDILRTWQATGGTSGPLGFPTTGDARTPDGRGYVVRFQDGDVWWSPATGAQVVRGAILATYRAAGGSSGPLGFPTTSDARSPEGRGYVVHFQGGDVWWSPTTGAQVVAGRILTTWLATGGPSGTLGFPTTSDARTPDGRGYVVRFQGGDVYWSPATDARAVTGALATEYAARGGSTSGLGFPTSSTYAVAGGLRNDFQGGVLTLTTATGAVTVGPR